MCSSRASLRGVAPKVAGGGFPSGSPAGSIPLSSDQIGPQAVSPSVSWADGGTLVKVHIPSDFVGEGGVRRAIASFSARSRRALLRLVNSIDRRQVEPSRVFLALCTYPATYPTARVSKRHIKVMLQRFRRAWGAAAIWKLEPQGRGAPHYHCLLFMQSQCTETELTAWWAENWHEVVETDDANHLAFHLGLLPRSEPCCTQIRSWNGVTSYAAKYLGKTFPSDPNWYLPGRFWGVVGRELLPIVFERRELPARVAALLRRACVRWYEHQPSGRFSFRNCSSEAWDAARGGSSRRLGGHGKVLRIWLDREGRESLDGMGILVPYHRRWPTSHGGCSMFIPDTIVKQFLAWAWSDAESRAIGDPGG